MKPGTRHFDRVNSRAEFNNYVPRNLFFFLLIPLFHGHAYM
jgi:hypothetical protein